MKIKKIDNRGIAMPFNWMFAIIVGIVILFIAIYGVGRLADTGDKVAGTETAAKLSIVFENLDSGLSSGKSSVVNLERESKVFLDCDYLSNRPFGLEWISFSEKNRGKFGEESERISIRDKYIFGSSEVYGEDLYLFSKPFYLGFDVGDLIVLSSNSYCFVDSPSRVLEEIEDFGLGNIKFEDSLEDCLDESVSICFNEGGCDIEVSSSDGFESGKVLKDGAELDYAGNLIFGGIFSDKEIYECNVKRLKNKFNELALIYESKINLLRGKGCDIDISLAEVRGMNVDSLGDLELLNEKVRGLDGVNGVLEEGCEVW